MAEGVIPNRRLEVGSVGAKAVGWWGVLAVVATEGALFAYLLFSYLYITVNVQGPWPPDGLPDLRIAGINSAILLTSSATFWWGEKEIEKGRMGRCTGLLALTLLLGFIFASLQLYEWSNKSFFINTGTYGSLFFTITGFHFAHVLAGLFVLALITLWSALGYFDEKRHVPISVGAVYWHFVDIVWLFVFTTLYLTPHWGLSHVR